MADEEEPTFESTDAGAADTYPAEAGTLRKGSHVMLKGKPCKVAEVTTSKTGKHGHAKAHIIGIDIFTGKKYEDLCPTSHSMPCPFVKRQEYQLLSLDADTGEVSLLEESGDTKDDLNLPTFNTTSDPTDEDKKVVADLTKDYEGEKNCFVAVLSACGQEKIVGHKVVEDKK